MNMKKMALFNFCLILLGIFIFLFLFPFKIQAEEWTQEEIEKHIQLPKTDARSILHSLPQVLTEQWLTLATSFAAPEKEAIVVIIRKAIRGKMMDYFLREGPKEVGRELIKIAPKVARLAIAPDISALFEEFQRVTVQQSLRYLGQWLKKNQIKIAVGNLDFSYETLAGEKQKHKFQYIIIYSPKNEQAVIRIYSNQPMSPPASRGSLMGIWGTGWNYSLDQVRGKKIPAFILSIQGKMSRDQGGYWGGKITHDYFWPSQPKITIEFPDNVPSFDFRKKGFLERTKDRVKSFFDRVGDSFSGLFGAALVSPPDIWVAPVKFFPEEEAKREYKEEYKEYQQQGYEQQEPEQELRQELESPITKEDLARVIEKLEKMQGQMDEMRVKIESSRIENRQLIEQRQEQKQEQEQEQEKNGEEAEEQELAEAIEDTLADTETVSESIAWTLLINEVCAGWDSAKNEFIELYNPNDFAVSLNSENFQLKLVNSRNKLSKKKITWNNNNIPAKGYFLLVGGDLASNGKKLQPDAVFSSQLTSVSGVIIVGKNDDVLDKVGWGKIDKLAPDLAIEKEGKILNKGLGTGKSLERTNHLDTNNNSSDFSLNQSPSPTNSKAEKGVYSAVRRSGSGRSGSGSSGSGGGSSGGAGGAPATSPEPIFCSQENLSESAYSPIIFNEIAWMGSEEHHNNEWIELKNTSTSTVSLNGWQILDKAGQIQIIFNENDSIAADGFYLLERIADDSVPEIIADKIYNGNGALGNNDESLRLFNSNCDLIDQVLANPSWPDGDNTSKRTMERGNDLSWHTYNGAGTGGIMGTPRAGNSQSKEGGDSENSNENGNGKPEQNGKQGGQEQATSTISLLITEVKAAGNEEFIELYNFSDQEISLNDFYLSYFSSSRDWNNPHLNKPFPTSIIPSRRYHLVSFGNYPGEPDPDWSPYESHLSDNNGSIGIFSCNPKIATTTTTTLSQAIEQAKACKIDALGWGETLVKEEPSATPSESKSLARRLAPNTQGYLQYVDDNNNNSDFKEQESTPRERNNHPYSDLDNDGIINSYDPVTILETDTIFSAGEYTFKDLFINKGVSLILNSAPNLDDGFKGVKISAENMTISENAVVSADKKGYGSSQGPGRGKSREGASHGGMGGRNFDKDLVYGSLTQPAKLGSGASGNPRRPACGYRPGGSGGGALRLIINDNLLLNGEISADAEAGESSVGYGCSGTAGGSGGSIYITTNTLTGSGKISAIGGNSPTFAGAGSGGRIAIHYNVKDNFIGFLEAFGGVNTYDNNNSGGSGTIYLKQESQTSADLIIDNNGLPGKTTLIGNELIFRDIKILGGAHLYLPARLSAASMALENSAVLEAEAASTISVSGDFSLNQSSISGPALIILIIEADNLFLINSTISANLSLQANNLTVAHNSSILSRGLGHPSQKGFGKGMNGSGAGYGGRGGGNAHSVYGASYGSQEKPIDFGSGGGESSRNNTITEGGKGGGAGGGGRVAIEGDVNNFIGQIETNGGQNVHNIDNNGENGTVFVSTP